MGAASDPLSKGSSKSACVLRPGMRLPDWWGGQTHSVVHHCLVSAGYLVSLSELLWMSSVVKCHFPEAILTGD